MGPGVSVKIDGREQLIRFGVRNSRLATSVLQGYLPQGADKLDIGGAARLIQRGDQDAVIIFLHAAMSADNERLTQQEVERMIERHVDKGGEIGDFVMPLLEALREARLVKVSYRTVVEEDGTGRPTGEGISAESGASSRD